MLKSDRLKSIPFNQVNSLPVQGGDCYRTGAIRFS